MSAPWQLVITEQYRARALKFFKRHPELRRARIDLAKAMGGGWNYQAGMASQ